MKAIICVSMLALTSCAYAGQSTRDADAILATQAPVEVNYDCGYLSFDVEPLIVEGKTTVELNGIFTAMGIALTWDGQNQKITGVKGSTTIELWIGDNTAYVNGQAVTLDVAPYIATPYNRTMVPVAFIAEATNANVSWNSLKRTVIITDNYCTEASQWQSGPLNNDIVDPTDLESLTIEKSNKLIWKSNNPEAIESAGWLMQSSRSDGNRGGSAYPLQGCFNSYLFHINKSGSTKYVHLLASNPNNSAANITIKGSMYNNNERPLTGLGAGLNYQVVYDWLFNTPRSDFSASISPFSAKQLVKIKLDSMIDGRYEICADKGVYLYTVATNSGSESDAINASQGSQARGFIAQPDTDKFGREAGIYQGSEMKGVQSIELPTTQSHLAFSFNTTNKIYTYLQDQTSAAVMHLDDSSDRTHGNYGHHYDMTLNLVNNSGSPKTVKFSFASNLTGSGPSFTWNSPALLNGSLKNIYVTPADPSQQLATYTVPGNSSFNINFETYVPGLITTNQQLILEVQ